MRLTSNMANHHLSIFPLHLIQVLSLRGLLVPECFREKRLVQTSEQGQSQEQPLLNSFHLYTKAGSLQVVNNSSHSCRLGSSYGVRLKKKKKSVFWKSIQQGWLSNLQPTDQNWLAKSQDQMVRKREGCPVSEKVAWNPHSCLIWILGCGRVHSHFKSNILLTNM